MRNVERFSKISKEEVGSVTEHPMAEKGKMSPVKKMKCKMQMQVSNRKGFVCTTLSPSERRMREGF